MADNKSVLVSGEPRAVSADFEGEPVERQDHKVVDNTAIVLELLRRTGNRIAANRNAIIFLEDEAKELEETFYDKLDKAGKSISDVHSSIDDNFSDITTRDKPGNWEHVNDSVPYITSGLERIQSSVNLLKEIGISANTWKDRVAIIKELSDKASIFSVNDKNIAFVDIGAVTKDDITAALTDKTKKVFSAIMGTLNSEPFTGWYFKIGDSGNGMIFCPTIKTVFSLSKKATRDAVDIKVILGDDTGNISDLTAEEQSLLALLKQTGVSSTVWNKMISDITALQERKATVQSLTENNLSNSLWKNLIININRFEALKAQISSLKSAGVSLNSWNRAKEKFLYDDNDEFLPKEGKLIRALKDVGLDYRSWNLLVNRIQQLSSLTRRVETLSKIELSNEKWFAILSDINSIKTVKNFFSAAIAAGFSPKTWLTVTTKGVLSMTQEERDFLNELMISGISEATWIKALADITELQATKTVVDDLVAAGLSADSWTTAQSDIRDLLEVKAFIDSLKESGFSVENWSKVWAAVLNAEPNPADPNGQ